MLLLGCAQEDFSIDFLVGHDMCAGRLPGIEKNDKLHKSKNHNLLDK